jgi:hypothetical protein
MENGIDEAGTTKHYSDKMKKKRKISTLIATPISMNILAVPHFIGRLYPTALGLPHVSNSAYRMVSSCFQVKLCPKESVPLHIQRKELPWINHPIEPFGHMMVRKTSHDCMFQDRQYDPMRDRSNPEIGR